MANTSKQQDTSKQAPDVPYNPMLQLEQAGLGSMMSMNTAWFEALSDMSAEVVGFVAERWKEDVKTQHEILHCKNVADLQHIQSQFMQKAMDQYQAETGKLIEMGTAAFVPKDKDA